VFVYHDVSLERLAKEWYGGPYPGFTGIRRWRSTGRWMNLHPIGTAVLMAPFFVAADLLTRWSNLPRDGFSVYYQHGAGLAGLTYFLLGLAMLKRILMAHFSDGVVVATLVCITWGTNLFHYGVFDGTFSHAYGFFLVCLWIWLVERWWNEPAAGRSLALGVVAALNVLTRHTNAIYLLVLPLYGVTRWSDVAVRVAELRDRRRMRAVGALAGTAIMLPQLALYKWITGAWVVNAYTTHDIGFSFGSPRVIATLFSTQKGLFFWSPVLLLSGIGVVVAGSFLLSLSFGDRHDLNERREPGGLAAWFRVRVALRDVRLEVLDCHAGRKCHRLLAVLADVELVRGGDFVHELALLLQHGPVVGHQIDKRRG
jgi:hypothetical protein